MASFDFNNPIYCVVTGASRGIGRTIAIEMARRAKNDIRLVLMARSEANLNETRKLIHDINKDAKVSNIVVDLSKADAEQYVNLLKPTFEGFKDPFSAVIFHNVGHIGIIDKAINLYDMKTWEDYYKLNLFSVTALNSMFVKIAKELTENLIVVNISSLMGRKPFSLFSMYGSSKAARDLYFKVLAEEEKYIRVLNWSPGLVESDMSNDVLNQLTKINGTEEKGDDFKNALSAEQTVNKMLKVLEENKFNSGDIIDYYDV